MQQVAQGWLAYDLTGSATVLGVVTAAVALPGLVLMLPGGVVADRWNRRRLLIVSQLLLTVNAAALALLVATGNVEPWHLAALGAAGNALATLNLPARQSLFPQLAGRALIPSAMGLFALSFNVSRVIGPALAGVLLSAVGAGGCFLFIAVTMALATGGMFALGPEPARESSKQERSVAQSFGDGLRFVWGEPIVLGLLVIFAVQNLFGLVYLPLMPVFARDVFAIGGGGLGLLLTASGIGATVGSLVAGGLGQGQRKGSLVISTGLLFGGAVTAFGLSPGVGLALVFLIVGGVFQLVTSTVNQTVLTLATPPELRGRVWSVHMMMWNLPMLAGLPGGWAADRIGAPFTVGACGILVVALTAGAGRAFERVRRFQDHG